MVALYSGKVDASSKQIADGVTLLQDTVSTSRA
jgi:hypothetical protein